jgi:hypothetical protein
MEAEPASPAGAVALLRFIANLIEFLYGDDEHERYVAAMRNAAGFFERSAPAWARRPKSRRHAERQSRKPSHVTKAAQAAIDAADGPEGYPGCLNEAEFGAGLIWGEVAGFEFRVAGSHNLVIIK